MKKITYIFIGIIGIFANFLHAQDLVKVNSLIDSVKRHQLKYNNLSIKADVNTKISDEDMKLDVNIKIARDSMIWISVSPGLNIEAVRILLTPDSIKYMNKLENTYFVGIYKDLKDLFNIQSDYTTLQALLSRSFFFTANCSFEEFLVNSLNCDSANSMQWEFEKMRDKYLQKFSFDQKTYLIRNSLVKDVLYSRSIEVQYTAKKGNEDEVFPDFMKIVTTNGNKGNEILVEIKKYNVDKKQSYSFRIPEKYSKIEFKK